MTGKKDIAASVRQRLLNTQTDTLRHWLTAHPPVPIQPFGPVWRTEQGRRGLAGVLNPDSPQLLARLTAQSPHARNQFVGCGE